MQNNAGASAAKRAMELRAKAARLEAQALCWEQGASGERRTAALLEELVDDGYIALHDLSIPGSKANVDHVLVGPSGVIVVDSKAYSGQLRISGGTMWHGRFPLRRELAALAFEASQVEQVAQAAGLEDPVQMVVCIHGTDVPMDTTGDLAPVRLCDATELHATVTHAHGRPLSSSDVARLSRAIAANLPPKEGERPLGLSEPKPVSRRPHRALRRQPSLSAKTLLDGLTRQALRALLLVVGFLLSLTLIAALAQGGLSYVQGLSSTTTTTVPADPAPAPPG